MPFFIAVTSWIHKLSHFSIFSTTSSYTTDVTIELSGVISYTDQQMSSFYMYHYCSFITTEFVANSTVTHTWTRLIWCIFSIRLISLVLRNTGQHLSIYIWAILNTKIISKKHKQIISKKHNVAPKRPPKGNVYCVRTEMRKKSFSLLDLRWEYAICCISNNSPLWTWPYLWKTLGIKF